MRFLKPSEHYIIKSPLVGFNYLISFDFDWLVYRWFIDSSLFILFVKLIGSSTYELAYRLACCKTPKYLFSNTLLQTLCSWKEHDGWYYKIIFRWSRTCIFIFVFTLVIVDFWSFSRVRRVRFTLLLLSCFTGFYYLLLLLLIGDVSSFPHSYLFMLYGSNHIQLLLRYYRFVLLFSYSCYRFDSSTLLLFVFSLDLLFV